VAISGIWARSTLPLCCARTQARPRPPADPIFVFRSKRADRVKMLVYDETGLVLIWKRL
jgi:transposase